MMRYFSLAEVLYCYDKETGFTLKWKGEGWGLADLSYAALLASDEVQELTEGEALRKKPSPAAFLQEFFKQAQ